MSTAACAAAAAAEPDGGGGEAPVMFEGESAAGFIEWVCGSRGGERLLFTELIDVFDDNGGGGEPDNAVRKKTEIV